jgi:hypothetical protein
MDRWFFWMPHNLRKHAISIKGRRNDQMEYHLPAVQGEYMHGSGKYQKCGTGII